MVLNKSPDIINLFCVVRLTCLLFIIIIITLSIYSGKLKISFKYATIISKGKGIIMKNLTGSQISGGGHFLADSKCLGPLGETVCKDKTFYIIAYNGGIGGLFAIYYQILWHIIYAFDNGYIPVVDMQHYYNQYFKDNRIYKDNSWEYYFKQPCNISLNDLTEDCNIIISKDDDINEGLSFESF